VRDVKYNHISALLPRSGNKKQEFGLWVAGATRLGMAKSF
jgi:hypothetical protein